ncbi:SDR family oxidoreductase [Stenotrophomonas tumulicola]
MARPYGVTYPGPADFCIPVYLRPPSCGKTTKSPVRRHVPDTARASNGLRRLRLLRRHADLQDTRMTAIAQPISNAALVFGGSRGIGAAIARRLAREGHPVALTYVSRPDNAAEVVAAIQAGGGQAIAIQADSADAEAIAAAVEQAVAHFGPLQVAVVNAGIYDSSPLADFRTEVLDRMLAVNVRGVFLALQSAAAAMNEGGRLITIGSNTAVRAGVVGSSVYAMTKAAVATLVRELALDLAPRRITINNIQPGPIETDITTDFIDYLVQRNPMGRVGQPDEVAGLAAWLASREASYMTGSSLTIDGGWVI